MSVATSFVSGILGRARLDSQEVTARGAGPGRMAAPVSSDETQPYRVDDQPDVYRVVNADGTTILECKDETSAHHYVDLLIKAYRAGYKSGYRVARASTERD